MEVTREYTYPQTCETPLKSFIDHVQAPSIPKDLASKIDHTFLKIDGTEEDIRKLCAEAREHQFATVCIRPNFVRLAAELLQGAKTVPITVVGFPSGTTSTASKVQETKDGVRDGAREIDMVIQLDALIRGDYAFALNDIRQVVEAAHPIPVKVIIETSSLNTDQKIIACALSKVAGAAFVKTSTGFAAGGATVEDIALMRRIVGPDMGVKASGGVRNRADALKMVEAGATRIGTSAGVSIVSATSDAGPETASKKSY